MTGYNRSWPWPLASLAKYNDYKKEEKEEDEEENISILNNNKSIMDLMFENDVNSDNSDEENEVDICFGGEIIKKDFLF